MNDHLEFREGRRLRAADLNQESAAHEGDLARHLALAHPANGPDRQLAGNVVSHPTGSPTVCITPTGVDAGVQLSVGDGTGADALRLGAAGGHRASGAVTSDRADVLVKGALRLTSQASPAAGPVPWSVRALDVRGDDGALIARELRIELAAPPGSPPQASRVAIGTVDNGFRPVMTVDGSGGMTVSGKLEVAGSVSQGEIPPDLADPRFAKILADLVARRVLAAATVGTNPMFQLSATVVAASSTPQKTVLRVRLTPNRVLVAWGAALEVVRQGRHQLSLLRVGNNAAPATPITIQRTTTWSPDLSAASPATLQVAVAAFDTQGALAARRVRRGPLSG
jgi:hypothetical protein